MATLLAHSDGKNTRYQKRGPKLAWADEHPRLVWMFVAGGVVLLSSIAVALLKAAGNQTVITDPADSQTVEHT